MTPTDLVNPGEVRLRAGLTGLIFLNIRVDELCWTLCI